MFWRLILVLVSLQWCHQADSASTGVDDCMLYPCKNAGTCIEDEGMGNFTCICASGYSGDTCAVDIDDCHSNACLNGGTCVDGVNSFSCICTSGFGGEDCSQVLGCTDDNGKFHEEYEAYGKDGICDTYYQCIKGQEQEIRCPNNTAFDPTINTCTHISFVPGCEDADKRITLGDVYCKDDDGSLNFNYFVDPKTCLSYRCSNGKAYNFTCAPPMVYDPWQEKCDFQENFPKCVPEAIEGTMTVGGSPSANKNVYVVFPTEPSQFSEVPSVYSWIGNGPVGYSTTTGDFLVTVNEVDISGFHATVTRYDVSSGWDQQLTLYWQSGISHGEADGSQYVGSSSSASSKTVHVTFKEAFTFRPAVQGWVRGSVRSNDRFTVTIENVRTTGFDAVVQSSSSWSQNPILYWSCMEIPSYQKSNTDEFEMEIASPDEISIPHPSPSWIATPAIGKLDENTFDIFGREVHLSTVNKLLEENSEFTPNYQTNRPSAVRTVLQIRGDRVYIDESNINFARGFKKIDVYARQLLAKNSTITFQAPLVCQSFDGDTCITTSDTEEDGNNGVDSPVVELNLRETIVENLDLISKGSEGLSGGFGKDGARGLDGLPVKDMSKGETCDHDCGSFLHDKDYAGRRGNDGKNGVNGGQAGHAGAGGSASAITFNIEKMTGHVTVYSESAKGGDSSPHGYGGKRGNGSPGGMGKRCNQKSMIFSYWCDDSSCCRGADGQPGYDAKDGFYVFPIPPPQGKHGSVERAKVNTLTSLKKQFKNQEDLLNLMRRYGEMVFQRNDNDEALDVFSFIVSVTDEGTTMHDEVSLRMDMINQGFDYYGHASDYAPDMDWSYYQKRTLGLLHYGQDVEDAFNLIQGQVNEINGINEAFQQVATISITAQKYALQQNANLLRQQKTLLGKAVRELELTMKVEIEAANVLCETAIKIEEIKKKFTAILGAVSAFVGGLIQPTPAAAFSDASDTKSFLKRDKCPTPSLDECTQSMQENLDFGYEYQRIPAANLDFTTMPVSSVSQIMISNLAKNKAQLTNELKCLFVDPSNPASDQLEIVINNFFRDAALRVSLLDDILEIDIQLNEIAYSREALSYAQDAIDSWVDDEANSVSMTTQMSFADILLNMYQLEENTIMHSLYELSKAYEFSCLWEFNALDRYTDVFSNEVLVDNTGSLQGMLELKSLFKKLSDEKDLFTNYVAPSAGPSSHVYTKIWSLNADENPEVFENLHATGSFSMKFEIDPDDKTSTGCDYCYNARLDSMYVEIHGENQPSNVPPRTYVKVSHMGDSSFLLPTNDGGNKVKLLRQTPENVDGGHIMTFEYGDNVDNIYDPELQELLSQQEHIFCDDTETFFGAEPCKSPFATYSVTVPRDDYYECSLNPDQHISGTNCKDLDFTRFDTIKVYAKINSWSDYPIQPDEDTMAMKIKQMKAKVKEQKKLK